MTTIQIARCASSSPLNCLVSASPLASSSHLEGVRMGDSQVTASGMATTPSTSYCSSSRPLRKALCERRPKFLGPLAVRRREPHRPGRPAKQIAPLIAASARDHSPRHGWRPPGGGCRSTIGVAGGEYGGVADDAHARVTTFGSTLQGEAAHSLALSEQGRRRLVARWRRRLLHRFDAGVVRGARYRRLLRPRASRCRRRRARADRTDGDGLCAHTGTREAALMRLPITLVRAQ